MHHNCACNCICPWQQLMYFHKHVTAYHSMCTVLVWTSWCLHNTCFVLPKQYQWWFVVCCSAAYIVALLHDGFKLGMHERRLRFTNYVEDPHGNSMDIDWTLGTVFLISAFTVRLHSFQDNLLLSCCNRFWSMPSVIACCLFNASMTYLRTLLTSTCFVSRTWRAAACTACGCNDCNSMVYNRLLWLPPLWMEFTDQAVLLCFALHSKLTTKYTSIFAHACVALCAFVVSLMLRHPFSSPSWLIVLCRCCGCSDCPYAVPCIWSSLLSATIQPFSALKQQLFWTHPCCSLDSGFHCCLGSAISWQVTLAEAHASQACWRHTWTCHSRKIPWLLDRIWSN